MRRVTHCMTIVALSSMALAGPSAATANQPVARSRPRPANPPELKRLEAKMEEVRETFLRDTNQLIKSFEDAGQYDRAKVLLEALQKLDPRNEPIKAKLGQLNEKILDSSEIELDVDAGFKFVRATVADVGANAQPGCLHYILTEPSHMTRPTQMVQAIA